MLPCLSIPPFSASSRHTGPSACSSMQRKFLQPLIQKRTRLGELCVTNLVLCSSCLSGGTCCLAAFAHRDFAHDVGASGGFKWWIRMVDSGCAGQGLRHSLVVHLSCPASLAKAHAPVTSCHCPRLPSRNLQTRPQRSWCSHRRCGNDSFLNTVEQNREDGRKAASTLGLKK